MDRNPPPEAPPSLESEDYYYEGPNLIFTAAYLLKRGVCCGSGCRHCPYGEMQTKEQKLPPQNKS